ncbi:MAG: helix-turn-helix protein [uncultured bacterium]|nr:MAG: helix-turn-helix protein [uncultured bacterium]
MRNKTSSYMLKNNIKKFRKNSGLTQQQLAEKAGLSYNVITTLEQGTAKQPTIQTIIKLADAFKISIDELVGRKL